MVMVIRKEKAEERGGRGRGTLRTQNHYYDAEDTYNDVSQTIDEMIRYNDMGHSLVEVKQMFSSLLAKRPSAITGLLNHRKVKSKP